MYRRTPPITLVYPIVKCFILCSFKHITFHLHGWELFTWIHWSVNLKLLQHDEIPFRSHSKNKYRPMFADFLMNTLVPILYRTVLYYKKIKGNFRTASKTAKKHIPVQTINSDLPRKVKKGVFRVLVSNLCLGQNRRCSQSVFLTWTPCLVLQADSKHALSGPVSLKCKLIPEVHLLIMHLIGGLRCKPNNFTYTRTLYFYLVLYSITFWSIHFYFVTQ